MHAQKGILRRRDKYQRYTGSNKFPYFLHEPKYLLLILKEQPHRDGSFKYPQHIMIIILRLHENLVHIAAARRE